MRYAFVNLQTKEIEGIGESNDFYGIQIGQEINGTFAVNFPDNIDLNEAKETLYYVFTGDHATSYFNIRGPRPDRECYTWNPTTTQWDFDAEKFTQCLRAQRNTRLFACDWTQLSDADLTAQEQADWATYRQALRDLPENSQNIYTLDEIPWPIAPS